MSVQDFAAAQAAEYGTYVATVAIDYDGARAFNPGDVVPVSHVKEYGYDKADSATGVVVKKFKPPTEDSATDKKKDS